MLPALPLLATQAGLAALWDLERRLEAALVLVALAFAALAWAAHRTAAVEAAGRVSRRTLAVAILLVAAAMRLLLLPLPPTLSDDLYRYAWDGRVVAAGANPYRLAPDAPELVGLRDELWQRLPHRHVATVYPPLALAAFATAAHLPAPLASLKVLFTAADLVGCLALMALARRLGLPLSRTLWYTWNPMVALEVAGMGHVDALGVAAMLAAVLALAAARPRLAGLAAGAGVLAKLAPLAALPAWARWSGRPGRFAAVALGVTVLGLAPVAAGTGGVPPGLLTYGVSWEFNGPVYEPLWRLVAAVDADAFVARALDQGKRWSGHHDAWNRLYPYVYPQLLAKLLLAGGMLTLVALSVRSRDPVAGSGRLFGGLLLLSATVYPWYLLWVLPWAALARHRAWLALSGLILLTYVAQLREVPLLPWVFAAVWGPFAVLTLAGRPWSTP